MAKADAWALLGLARRAGAVQVGVDAARESLRAGNAQLLICAPDGSEAQRRKVEALAEAREVICLIGPDRNELGRWVGSGPLTAVAVTDVALAREIRARAVSGSPEESGGPSKYRR